MFWREREREREKMRQGEERKSDIYIEENKKLLICNDTVAVLQFFFTISSFYKSE